MLHMSKEDYVTTYFTWKRIRVLILSKKRCKCKEYLIKHHSSQKQKQQFLYVRIKSFFSFKAY